jgi:RimJ/RimL family protein N-acetyltransferase
MLTGTLVVLRPIEPADYPVLGSYVNDIEVEVLSGGDPPTPTPQASTAERWEAARTGEDIAFAIVERAAGQLIGQCALFNHHPVNSTAELGITIGDRAFWGRGYGREAVSMLTEYGFRYRNLHKVHLSTNATNERAIRAYRAAGFVEEGRLRQHVWSDGAYIDLVEMGRLRDDPQLPGR